jgi:hypothetical protein
MSMRISAGACATRVVFGVFAILAAGQLRALADTNDSPAGLRAKVDALPRIALNRAPPQTGKRAFGTDAQVHQIDLYAMRRRLEPHLFASWYFRRYCRIAEPPQFCGSALFPRETAQLAAMLPSEATETAPAGDISSPHADGSVSTAMFAQSSGWLVPKMPISGARAQPIAFHPCGSSCGPFAAIVQTSSNGGIDIAVEYQSGANVAVTVQDATGPAVNNAVTIQSGECNRALTVQVTMDGSNNSSLIQAGYRNTAMVNQH